MVPPLTATTGTLAISISFLTVVILTLLLIKYHTLLSSLRFERDYLTKIINAANEGIYVTDRQRRFIIWNEAAGRISGYQAEDVIGSYCHDNILCHTDRQGTELCHDRCPLLDAAETGRVHGPTILSLRHKDGRRVSVEVKTAPLRDDEGNVIGGVEIFEDVTERLEKERLLTERREKLETVLDSISDGILFLDSSGNINVYNYALSEMFGIGKDCSGRNIHALPPDKPLKQALDLVDQGFRRPDDAEQSTRPDCAREASGALRCWTRVMKRSFSSAPSPCYNCETFRITREFLERPKELVWGKRTISVESSFIELREVGELWEVVIFHDVSAEKLDAALKVAGAAAHELRQPLQVIIILAGILGREAGENESLRQHVQAMTTSCKRMEDIIKKMCMITSYKIKDYADGVKILDFDKSSNKDEGGVL